MRWDTVLFDLDGTLTDSQEGIVKSVSYALERLGRELPPRDTLTAFIGPPLHESFSAICDMDEAETERAVCEFRDYFARRGWAENVPYEGMAEFLAALHAAGLRLVDCNVEAGGVCAENFASILSWRSILTSSAAPVWRISPARTRRASCARRSCAPM